MSTTGVPVDLAQAMTRAADSRTCETLPGADSSSGVDIVWIESTISSAGRTRSAASSTAEMSVSVSTSNVSWPSAVRSARSLICSADSSPET